MTTTGPNIAGTGADDSAVGTITWATPSNITADDGSEAAASVTASAITHYLKGTNFGFSIPSGDTIDGILVEIDRRAQTASRITDVTVSIVKGGTVTGDNKAIGTTWPTALTYQSYGGAADLWGATWTDSDINASNFGLVISCTNSSGTVGARVDAIRITITHTTPGGTTYNQSAGGTLTTSGNPSKQTGKPVSGTVSTAGNPAKTMGKLLSGTLAIDGGLLRQAGKLVSGVLTTAGNITKTTLKMAGGAISADGSLSKLTNKILGGALATSGNVARVISKFLGGALSLAGELAAALSGIATPVLLTLKTRTRQLV